MPVRKKKSEEGESVRTTSGGRKVSVVLPAELAERVQRLADVRAEPLTKAVVRLVEAGERATHEAIREDAVGTLRAELLAAVEAAGAEVRGDVRKQAQRLSHLLARTALESMAGRIATGSALYKLYGERETAMKHYNEAWKSAVDRLKSPTPAMRETLNEIAAGAGDIEPGAVAHVADAARELREQVEALSELVGGVGTQQDKGQAADTATAAALSKIAARLDALSGQVATLHRQLGAVEEEVKRPRGLFGGR